MKHSDFLSSLLASAELLRVKNGLKCLSAGLIVAAASNYCLQEYTGAVETHRPEKFEPERLRLAYSMFTTHRLTLAPFICVKLRNPKNALDVPFDFLSSMRVAHHRGKVLLSADIVFLEAAARFLPHLLSSIRNNPLFKDGVDTFAIQKEIDKKILPYTKTLLSELREPREWRLKEIKQLEELPPKVKLMDAAAMSEAFKKSVKINLEEKVLTLSIPDFFDNDAPLTLHIHRAGRLYMVHDNGSALRYLRKCYKRPGDVIDALTEPSVFDGENFLGAFQSADTFMSYIQRVVMLAHGYLYFNAITRPFLKFCLDYDTLKHKRDPLGDNLLPLLSDVISFGYVENVGNIIKLKTAPSVSSIGWAFYIEARGINITVKDLNRGQVKGEILETLHKYHGIIGLDFEFISPYFLRFGGSLEEGEIVMHDEFPEWRRVLLRYFNMAVIITNVASLIRPY